MYLVLLSLLFVIIVPSVLFVATANRMVKAFNREQRHAGPKLTLFQALTSRDAFFAALWTTEQARLQHMTLTRRKRLFSVIQKGWRVLELGPGFGNSFAALRDAGVRTVAVVEPNEHMHAALRDAAATAGLPEFHLFSTLKDALNEFGPASFDAVLSLFVLCSVPCVRSTIQEARTMLREGGVFLSMDHVARTSVCGYRCLKLREKFKLGRYRILYHALASMF